MTLAVAAALLLATLYPLSHLGSEFMPALDEGDLLYMPSTLPGISAREAGRLLQQTDRLIKTVPEVDTVFGKAGRAETATDPAPLTMIETTIRFKPKDQWRPGMTMDKLVSELESIVKVPGIANIANRLKNDYILCADMRQRSIVGCYQNNVAWLYLGSPHPQPTGYAGDRDQKPGGHQSERQ